jgi:hypothetical protein
MTENEKILFHRLMFVLADLNSQLDAETAELVFHDLSKASGKSQGEIVSMLSNVI